MKTSITSITLAGLVTLAVAPLHAQSGIASVDTRTSLYLAGGNTYSVAPGGGGGLAPTAITLLAGTGRVLTVTADGSAAYCGAGVCVAPTPDGPAIGSTNLNASGSISGIVAPTSGFLAGLFLGPSLPGAAPSSLNFNTLTTTFASVAPAVGQLFFIGDGLAGALQQQFLVPDGATRLYFGIADGFAFVGDPGFYDDNVGTYRAIYAVSAVPEPSTWALLATGLATLGGIAARRRRTG